MMAADSPNWFALIGDVNLPEHRGTVYGLGNFINGIGRGIGSIILPLIALSFGATESDPSGYIWALITVQLFFIPTGFCYFAATFFIKKDYNHVKQILRNRAQDFKKGR
jgi:MFS family permease